MSITVLAIALSWSTVSIVTVAVCIATARDDDAFATASRTTSLPGAPTGRSLAALRQWAVNVRAALTR
jgi:hypothetical protein